MRRRTLMDKKIDPHKPMIDAFIERVKAKNGSFLYDTEEQTRLIIKEHIKLLGDLPKLDWLAYKTDSNGNVTSLYSIDALYDSVSIHGTIQVKNNKFTSSDSTIRMTYTDTKFTLSHIIYDGKLKQYNDRASVFVCGIMVSPYTSINHMFFQQNMLNIQYAPDEPDGYSVPYNSGQIIDIVFGKTNYIESLKLDRVSVTPVKGMVDFWQREMDATFVKIYEDFNHVLGC